MKVYLIKTAVIIIVFNNISFAQFSFVTEDSVYNTNLFRTTLYNDINSANLISLLNYNKNFSRLGVSVENYYLSNVSKLNQNFYRDYNNFRMLVYYNIKNNFNAGLGFQNRFLADDKNIGTNKNNSNYFFTNFDYTLSNNIFVNSEIGVKAEDQIGEYNIGFSGIATATANNFFYNDYLSNGYVTFFYENLMQKQNHNYEINGNVYKRFSPATDNNGLLKYYNRLNDFYAPASPSVILSME